MVATTDLTFSTGWSRAHCFVSACDAYSADFTSELAFVGVMLPAVFGLMLAFQLAHEWLNGHKRLLFNFILAQMLFIQAIIGLLLQTLLPPLEIDGPSCAGRNIAVICDESATAGLVFIYFFMYDTLLTPSGDRSETNSFDTLLRYSVLVAFVVLSCWGQAYLHYYHISEILIGLCLGAVDGIFISYLLYRYIVPNVQHPCIMWFMRMFSVNDKFLLFQDDFLSYMK